MVQRWARGSALVCALLFAFSASAQDGSSRGPDVRLQTLVLDSSECSSVARDELRELVALELAPRVVRMPSEVSDDASVTRAKLTCSETHARLYVRDAAWQQQQELGLDLAQIDRAARARLLALALAELVATVDMEAGASSQERAKAAEPPAPLQARSPQRTAQRSWWMGAGVAREGRPRLLAPSLQSGVVLSVTKLPLAVLSELQLQRGVRSVSAGRVSAWTFSGSLGLAGQLRAGRSDLALGLGLRLGYARLVGEASSADQTVSNHAVSGLWWGPTMSASAVLPLLLRWGLRAGIDLTWVARGVRGLDSAGAVAYQLEGLLVNATLGLSLGL